MQAYCRIINWKIFQVWLLILQVPVVSITNECMVCSAKTWNGYTAPECSVCV